jgi:hypothetical protein
VEQINEEDQVGIFLDTCHDRRHSVFFFINPAGIQQEGTFMEGEEEPDFSWDTIWNSDARVLKQGWIGYISVPFKSLRFKSTTEVQDWGILLERDIPHNSMEHSFHPRYSMNVQGLLTQEGSLSGLEENFSRPEFSVHTLCLHAILPRSRPARSQQFSLRVKEHRGESWVGCEGCH